MFEATCVFFLLGFSGFYCVCSGIDRESLVTVGPIVCICLTPSVDAPTWINIDFKMGTKETPELISTAYTCRVLQHYIIQFRIATAVG